MKKVLIGACVCAISVWTGCQSGPSGSGSAPSASSPRESNVRVAERSARENPAPAPVAPAKPPKPLTKLAPLPETVEADRLYLAGDYTKAYDLYCKAIRARSSELDAHDGLSLCVTVLHRYSDGCAFYEKLLKNNPQDPFLLYGTARMYLTVGDRQLASGTAYRSIRYNSNLSRSFYLIALMQATDSEPRLKSAERAFEQTLEREPDYGPAYYQLALLNAASSATRPRAKDLAMKALETLRPVERETRSETRLLLGALCVADQDYDRALVVFREGLQEEGPSFYEKADIGLLLQKMNRSDEARREWAKVVDVFGLGESTGLTAYGEAFKFQDGNVDHSAFLPRSATPADYRDLVFYLGQPGSVKRVSVPKELQGSLDEYRTPVFYKKVDLDGDGKEESIVVDARPTLDVGKEWKGQNLPRLEKHWKLSNPNLYIFNSSGALVGSYTSHMDHFFSIDTVDFQNNGSHQIVLTEFGGGNVLNLVVFVKRDVQYQPVLVCPVECAEEACGVLIADLDGDGRRELMTVSGDSLWVDIYRFGKDGTFAPCQKDFPRFYRDYLARYSKASTEVLNADPDLREHIERARLIVGGDTNDTPAPAVVVKASGAKRP